MKLQGIEVENFGNFKAQYIPITPGIQLLVGRNDAGKTSLITALQFMSQSKTHGPYLQTGNSSIIDLIFEVEESDYHMINAPGHSPFITREVKTTARVSIAMRGPTIIGAKLSNQNHQDITWIGNTAGGRLFRNPLANGATQVGRQDLGAANDMSQLESIFKEVIQFKEILAIPAQRVGNVTVPATADTVLPVNGSNLASYIYTLQLNHPDDYAILNTAITAMFPDFRMVNSRVNGNQVTVHVTYKSGLVVPLSACGSGVAHILIMLACIVRAKSGQIIVLDEPSIFLHPAAEKALLNFLKKYADRKIVIATHSSVLINGVDSNRITPIIPPGIGFTDYQTQTTETSQILHHLGMKNSDASFNDLLMLVEGQSDASILPKILRLIGIPEETLDWTGFPFLEGANPVKDVADLSRQIIKQEKLITSLGRAAIRRVYVLDGDRDSADIRRIPMGKAATCVFLPRPELENYILSPNAIARAIEEEALIYDVEIKSTAAQIESLLSEIAKVQSLEKQKCSECLAVVYKNFQMRYSKTNSGQLIASHLSKDWPALLELKSVLEPFFRG